MLQEQEIARFGATELVRRPGSIIDTAMREGFVAITRRHRVVAVMLRDATELPPTLELQPLPASDMVKNVQNVLDQTEANTGAFEITRKGRTVAYLLPRMYFEELGQNSE